MDAGLLLENQWLQIASRASLPGWTGSSAGQVAPTIATKNLLLSLPVEGNWPRSYPLQRYMNLNGQEELQ